MKAFLESIIPVGLLFSLVFSVLTLKLWIFGSLAVSTVKAVSDSCGKTYPIEVYVINGNWFCSEGK